MIVPHSECAVIGVADKLKGEKPLGFVVLKHGANVTSEQINKELIRVIRSQIGAFACFDQVYVVNKLPKTRSGKILRATIRRIADGETVVVPPTIDDPAILDEIGAVLRPD